MVQCNRRVLLTAVLVGLLQVGKAQVCSSLSPPQMHLIEGGSHTGEHWCG